MPQSNKIYLRPGKFINTWGKLAYGESSQAWNVLRLKKEILTEFPQLKEKVSQLFYNIMFIKDYKVLINHLLKMEKDNMPLPLLVWFFKGKIDE